MLHGLRIDIRIKALGSRENHNVHNQFDLRRLEGNLDIPGNEKAYYRGWPEGAMKALFLYLSRFSSNASALPKGKSRRGSNWFIASLQAAYKGPPMI